MTYGYEPEHLVEIDGACAFDTSGEVLAVFERGHQSPWNLREWYRTEYGEDVWPKREWWREVPWSIEYPDDPPCGDGEESILYVPCKRTDAGAFPVLVVWSS